MSRIAVGTLIAAVIASCASAGAPYGPEVADNPTSLIGTSTGGMVRVAEGEPARAMQLEASADQVWALLPEVYRTLEVAAEVQDRRALSYGTRSFSEGRIAGTRTEAFVRCGHSGAGPSSATRYRVRLTVLTTLARAPDGGTRLSTEVGGTATPMDGTSTGTVRCVTTGRLELRIQRLLEEKLAS